MATRTCKVGLRDSAVVEVRRLDDDDYDAIVRLCETLTDRERYMRFFTTHPAYLDAWARSLLEPAGGDRCTVGAFEDDELIGVANYIATAEPGRAEVSVLVAHQQHERGVGTALLHVLGPIARNNGIHHLVADVLAENLSMQRVITDAGWPCTCRRDAFVMAYDIDLDAATTPAGNGPRCDAGSPDAQSP